eukprot:CAMPEP_0170599292 /NCGR_PEP_ID=MMETSP0224-20130122/16715_1 /TAXON_ID=285029 /ORGANISM="Togula jolla, Strain CCCM 725" /LENGTH=360 /DNA_ID=CAMNT_0010923925 /DNA_START=61 /DNA_END=1143 /DNA_ORIENTATION=-
MAGRRTSEQAHQAECYPLPMSSYGAVVKNTFLHVVDDEEISADESLLLGRRPRREKSEPVKLGRSFYASGDSMCSTMLGSRSSEAQEEKAYESDSSWKATWRFKSEESCAETAQDQQDHSSSNMSGSLNGQGRRRRSGGQTRHLDQWADDVVTVMVRQIPRHFTQMDFLKLVNRSGFKGLFNFLYLPYDYKKGINVGYGFVSFVKPEHAQEFHVAFDGVNVEKRSRMRWKPFHVHPASVQGYDANWQHFMQTKVGQNLDPHFSPLFFPDAGTEAEMGADTEELPVRSSRDRESGTRKAMKSTSTASRPPGQWQQLSMGESPCPQHGVEHDLSDRHRAPRGMGFSDMQRSFGSVTPLRWNH